MLIHFSTLVLASQLLMTVADNVPQFNIERGCRADNTNTSGLSVGMDELTKSCINDEQAARSSSFRRSGRSLLPPIELCVLPMRLMFPERRPVTLTY